MAQVVFAPIPGQAVALAGGFVFGFWKGWGLTTLGLALGSAIAMVLARAFGTAFVRRFVPRGVMERFDSLIEQGGYTTFFMIFLLPALPDDAVCFIAGLTKLKLLPLSLVCLLGRAPGMAVLSLVGAQLTAGVSPGVKLLFAALMIVSVPLWLFWEVIEEKLAAFALRK
ncbi:MAG: TVP38/TMEM64 family protein, partial [Pyramidobacter sp.]|nr:TVP38/TMEM64 family protein [Pyramidobacter sp.]